MEGFSLERKMIFHVVLTRICLSVWLGCFPSWLPLVAFLFNFGMLVLECCLRGLLVPSSSSCIIYQTLLISYLWPPQVFPVSLFCLSRRNSNFLQPGMERRQSKASSNGLNWLFSIFPLPFFRGKKMKREVLSKQLSL